MEPVGGEEDRKEKPPLNFFSRIKQRVEPLEYFLRLLGLLLKYASLADSCDKSKREIVWKHIIDLYNSDAPPTNDLFSPVVNIWRNSHLMDLEAIEIYYLGFSNALLEHPNLLESTTLPFPVPNRIPPIPNGYKMVWGNGIIAQMQQLNLLMNWAPRLDKLAPKHKDLIWAQCQTFEMFTPEEFDRSSFRHTLAAWVEPPMRGTLQLATILFHVIGFLCECGIIKHRFCYPNTLVAVFSKQPCKTKYNKDEYLLVMRQGADAVPFPEAELVQRAKERENEAATNSNRLPDSSLSQNLPSGSQKR